MIFMVEEHFIHTLDAPLDSPSPNDHIITVETVFGNITVNRKQLIQLPAGLLGFPHIQAFALSDIPQQKFRHAWLMQPVPAKKEAFLVLPLVQTVYEKNMMNISKLTGFNIDNMQFLALLTLQKEGDFIRGTLNIKAPIVLNMELQQARQVILESPEYPLHKLVIEHRV